MTEISLKAEEIFKIGSFDVTNSLFLTCIVSLILISFAFLFYRKVNIISLSFRLFGNVFAGEVLLTIIFFLAPYFIPLPFLFLELFVGLIQAFLFAMLTLVSISLHTAVHEH